MTAALSIKDVSNNTNMESVDRTEIEDHSMAKTPSNCGDDTVEKSHSFRKRRLTLPNHRMQGATKAAAAAAGLDQSDDEDGEPSKKKPKTEESDESEANTVLQSRVLHAGELMRRFSNPSSVPDHRLYQGPFAPAENPQELSADEAPWKKRHTRHHHEDDTVLPFPRHVVGTYSCHGVEPVYDSDFAPDEEDDVEEDGDWLPPGGKAPAKKKEEELKEVGKESSGEEPSTQLSAKINQDRACVLFPYGNCPRTALFAAFDGHGQGGELVSQYVNHEIPTRLEKHPDFVSNIEKAFKDTFHEVDDALTTESGIEPLYAGTTAVVALLRDKVLSIANAGDSRAVMARKLGDGNGSTTWQAKDLTQDQNPDLPEEQARIEKAGGHVSAPPENGLSARVWLDCDFSMIGLAMSRSIGDHAVKEVGVIAEPVVTTYQVADEDDFMILATDGVWEFVSSQEAVDVVSKYLDKDGSTKACQKLIEAAAAKWHDEEGDYRDDITAVVVRLQDLWKTAPQTAQQGDN